MIICRFCLFLFSILVVTQLRGQNMSQADSIKWLQKVLEKQNYVYKPSTNPLPFANNSQDCQNAIPVCQQTYTQPIPLEGSGAILDLLPNATCLGAGEKNAEWYIFNVRTGGTFGFNIQTDGPTNIDYDFALWNVSSADCQAIANGLEPVRCNYAANTNVGNTGLDPNNVQAGNMSYGAGGQPVMPGMTITAGETYILIVSRFGTDPFGYTITFTGSASIFDNVPPEVADVKNLCPSNVKKAVITFSEPVNCSTVSTADFTISVNGQVVAPVVVTCGPGTFASTVTVEIGGNITIGTNYNLNVIGDIRDNCNNPLVVPKTFPVQLPSLTLLNKQNVICKGANTGSLTVSATGKAPINYYLNGGAAQQTGVFANITAGSYSVSITDAAGCTASISVTVSEPAAGIAISLNKTNVICSNAATGSITSTVTGAVNPFTYSWSNGATTPNLSNLTTGNYTLTITDANGCTMSSTAQVGLSSPPLIVSAQKTDVSCRGQSTGSIQLSVSGGTPPFQFQWSNGATTQNLNNLPAGVYSVTVTDANVCTAATTVTVGQPASALSATITPTHVACFGQASGSVDLIPAGGSSPYTYFWNTGSTAQFLTNVTAGAYSVLVTDNRGCTVSLSTTVTQPATGLKINGVTTPIICTSTATGSIDVTVSGGTTPYTYSWSNGATTEDLVNLIAGTYTLIVTDANNCTRSASFQINQPPFLTIGSAITDVNCGNTLGAIGINVSGGTSPYAFLWSNGSTTEDQTAIAPGHYALKVTDANGCTQTSAYTVKAVGLFTLSSNKDDVACHGESTGYAQVLVSGSNSPFTYQWSNGATGNQINNIPAGTYKVVVKDQTFCADSITIVIKQPASGLSLSAASTDLSCNGGSNGAINLSVTGGTLPYTYLWSNGKTTEDLNNLSTGNYSVTVTDGNGCLATLAKTITEPAIGLTVNANATQILCAGANSGAIDLTVLGGTPPYTYQWSNGKTTEDINNLTAGTYSFTVKDANQCVQSGSVQINQPSALAISGQMTAVSCGGLADGSISINVSGGTTPYAFLWNNGKTTQNLNGLVAANYSVVVTDASGCQRTANFTVSQPTNLQISFTQTNVSCFGGANGSINTAVSGGTPPYQYSWTNGQTTPNLANLTSGNYVLTISDANNCPIKQAVVITQPAQPLAGTLAITDNSCKNGNSGAIDLTVSGGTSPYSFSWSNGSTGEDLGNLPAGNYSVIIKDANGCTFSVSGIVSEPPTVIDLSYTVAYPTCFNSADGSIQLTVTGGVLPYQYLWSNGETTQNISTLVAGNYQVTVTDALGCVKNGQIALISPSSINISATVTNVSCNGLSNGKIDLNVTGGMAPYTFAWSNNQTTQTISGLSAGNYTVKITDFNGCIQNFTTTVAQPAVLALTFSQQNVSCKGGSNGLLDLTVSGGTPPYNYVWNNGFTGQDPASLPAGAYDVSITDANLCALSKNFVITEPGTLLALNPVATNIACNGQNTGAINLLISGGVSPYQIAWSNGSTASHLNNLSAGVYSATVTDAANCVKTVSVTLSQPLALVVSPQISNVTCFNTATGSIKLNVSGGKSPYTVQWAHGPTTLQINALTAGNYSATIADANGCTLNQSFSVTQPNLLTVSAAVSDVSCKGGTDGAIETTISGGTLPYSFLWTNGSTTEDPTGLSAGTFGLKVTDANGCTASLNAVVNEPTALTVSATKVNVTCKGLSNGSIDLTVSGATPPYTYLWNDGFTTPDRAQLVAGLYSVTVSDAKSCVKTLSISILEPAALSILANITPVKCNGQADGMADMTVTGGTPPYHYSWSNGQTNEDQINLSAGTYVFTATDTNGCTTVKNILITQPFPLIANVQISPIDCYGDSTAQIALNVSGGKPPYQYVWSNGQTSHTGTNLPAGNYQIIVTDQNGCQLTLNKTVSQPPPLEVWVLNQKNVICKGGANGGFQLSPTGGTPPYQYSINGFNWQSSALYSNLPAGTYQTVVRDAKLCKTMTTIIISEPEFALAIDSAAVTNLICPQTQNGQIQIFASGGVGAYIYSINNGLSFQSQPLFTDLNGGQYPVIVRDENGCSVEQTIAIFEPKPFAFNLIVNNVSCEGLADAGVSAELSGGTPPYLFSLNGGAFQSDSKFSFLPIGQYDVSARDANGCDVKSKPVVVTQPPRLEIAGLVSYDAQCFGSKTGSARASAKGGSPPYFFFWSIDPEISADDSITALAAGAYWLFIADANGCATDTLYFKITEYPPVFAGKDTALCLIDSEIGDFLLLGPGSPFGGTWSGLGVANHSDVFDPALLPRYGDYPVVYTYKGCADTTIITVEGLRLYGEKAYETCIGELRFPLPQVTPLGGKWSYAGVDDERNLDVNLLTLGIGTHQVTYTTLAGCSQSFSISVRDMPQAVITTNPNAINDSVLMYLPFSQIVFENSSTDITNFYWSFADSLLYEAKISKFIGKAGVYPLKLMVTNEYGCADTASLEIIVTDSTGIVIPNAFSPNSDGVNDQFIINGLEIARHEVQIFHRWDGLIHKHSTEGGYSEWDGSGRNGQTVPEGVYGILFRATKNDGREIQIRGTVTVLK